MKQDDARDEAADRNWLEKLVQRFTPEPRNRTDLLQLLHAASTRGLLDDEALGIFQGTLLVSDMQVREIMVPRAQMVCLKAESPLEDIMATVIDSSHSRFPVIDGSKDDVLGILLAKDLLPRLLKKEQMPFDLGSLLRPAQIVPESKRLNVLLREFRENRSHMVIVIDEYGGVAGLATIEDVLEEIVGEIEDEHDETDQYFRQTGDGEYLVKALMPIEELNAHFQTQFSDEEYDTIGGLVTHAIGHLPQQEEETEINRIHFRVTKADNRRVHWLQMTLPQ
jgi:magnesium and cobalt transporter